VKSLLLPLVCAQAFASSNDWPVYRHDVALSGASPGKGNITLPEVKWEYYLGAPFVPIAMAGAPPAENVADLAGDGTLERFSLKDKTIEVTDLSGHRLWSFTVEGHPLGETSVSASSFPIARVNRSFPFRAAWTQEKDKDTASVSITVLPTGSWPGPQVLSRINTLHLDRGRCGW